MRYMLLIMLLVCGAAMAAGGKVREANPIIGDGCIYQIPPGLDLEQCEAINATSQSGKEVVVYYCDVSVIVFCGDDE